MKTVTNGGGNMTKKEISYRANIGGPSLILIFIVMCLVTFGMLSLSAAKNERDLAQRNASAVTEYYLTDVEGEEFYQMVLGEVKDIKKSGIEAGAYEEILKQELGDYYHPEDKTVSTQIPMAHSQALLIELFPSFEGEGDVRVAKWKVIHTEDYAVDTTMPVWDGGESNKQETGK
jgi:hypothetical protein